MPRIKPGSNPATWMLEVTSSGEENRIGVDFAEVYRRSDLFRFVYTPNFPYVMKFCYLDLTL